MPTKPYSIGTSIDYKTCTFDMDGKIQSLWIPAVVHSGVDSLNNLYISSAGNIFLADLSNIVPAGTHIYRNGSSDIHPNQYVEVFYEGCWKDAKVIDIERDNIELEVGNEKNYKTKTSYIQQLYTSTLPIPKHIPRRQILYPAQKVPISILKNKNMCNLLGHLSIGFKTIFDYVSCSKYKIGEIVLFKTYVAHIVIVRNAFVLIQYRKQLCCEVNTWVAMCNIQQINGVFIFKK